MSWVFSLWSVLGMYVCLCLCVCQCVCLSVYPWPSQSCNIRILEYSNTPNTDVQNIRIPYSNTEIFKIFEYSVFEYWKITIFEYSIRILYTGLFSRASFFREIPISIFHVFYFRESLTVLFCTIVLSKWSI